MGLELRLQLIVAGYWSEGGPDRFQQCGAEGATFQLCDSLSTSPGPGLDERDGAFMERLRNLATSGGEAAAGVGGCGGVGRRATAGPPSGVRAYWNLQLGD